MSKDGRKRDKKPDDPKVEPPTAPPAAAGGAGKGNGAGRVHKRPTLDDLAGMKSVRAWGEQLRRDMADLKAGKITFEEMDRGAVFTGPPGTGKTTAARAIADACGVPFIVTSYTAWQTAGEGHLGHVQQKMKRVFDDAASKKPCIVLIDEIDTLPPRQGEREHKDWYVSIVNALLEFLDGAKGREGVIVIGACNDPSRLDEALTRPGRLDRRITVERPTIDELEQIYRYYLGADLADIDLRRIAALSMGMTGADVEARVREARRTARYAERALSEDDVLRATLGSTEDLPEDYLRRTAVHEAGHAYLALHLGIARSVAVSIVRAGDKLGMTQIDRRMQPQTIDVIERDIAVQLGGRAAEHVVYNSVTAGAGGPEESDLARATDLATQVVTTFGLSDRNGLIWYSRSNRDHLLMASPPAHEEVRAILDRAYAHACAMIRKDLVAFLKLVEGLVRRKALANPEIVTLIGPSPRNEDPPVAA